MQLKVPPDTDIRVPKKAADLKVGDWLADYGPVEAISEVLAVTPYTDAVAVAKVVVVFRNAYEPSPEIGRWLAEQEVRLATEGEIAAAREAGHRAEFVAGVRAFADWIEARPWLPVPYSRRTQARFLAEDDADKLVEARAIAEQLGVTPQIEDGHITVTARVAGFEYCVFDNRPKPVELVADGGCE